MSVILSANFPFLGAKMSFKKVAAGMARKQGISVERASAELAASTRRASPAARRKNPKLNRVKGTLHNPQKPYGDNAKIANMGYADSNGGVKAPKCYSCPGKMGRHNT